MQLGIGSLTREDRAATRQPSENPVADRAVALPSSILTGAKRTEA